MGPKRKRHVYALFRDRDQATAAYEKVRRDCGSEHCNVLMHQDLLDAEQLTLSETAAREGAKKGAMLAGAAGAVIVGLLAIPDGLLGLRPIVAALVGGAVGAAFGTLLGSITGASAPDKTLRNIDAQVRAGQILITIETDDPALEQLCEQVFATHGGMRVN